jgi:hypothetical protein
VRAWGLRGGRVRVHSACRDGIGRRYIRAFAAGHFHLLVLVGAGGLAKSRSVRAVLGRKGCWIEGNATPFGMYVKLYRHRDPFVVIDDVDALDTDRSDVRLLKCLCQTEEEKAVAWHSDARSLERQGIPREFVTKSRVVIIANDWQTLNRNVAALQDRGHVLFFQPGAAEVHRQAGTWFDDAEIYDWLGWPANWARRVARSPRPNRSSDGHRPSSSTIAVSLGIDS